MRLLIAFANVSETQKGDNRPRPVALAQSRPSGVRGEEVRLADSKKSVLRPHKQPASALARAVREMQRAAEGKLEDEIDWIKIERRRHFDRLSDAEWQAVWVNVITALGKRLPTAKPEQIRGSVDDAALSSGWFFEFQDGIKISPKDFRDWANRGQQFLQELISFKSAAAKFFGEPDDSPNDTYDPWPERTILRELELLEHRVGRQIAKYYESARSTPKAAANSAKPERDLWMSRLMLIWTEECGLSAKNSKHLRQFIVSAVRPYIGNISDRAAEQFIERWNRGKIERPQQSLWSRLRNNS